ncbi:MAG: cysteine desulfurase [Sphingomonadales bacterium]|nr:cysteine desulfurase [Sphingomonadales bacterium]
MSLDVQKIKADFPILSEPMNGKPLVFLDSGASAQKPQAVIDAVSNVYSKCYANIHRGIYRLSQDATEHYEQAREKVRALINANEARQCIFVRGATEGINLVAQSWGRANLNAGDEIILSYLEHHSNIVPWQMIAEERGAKIRVIPINDLGEVDIDAYKALLSPKTKMVALVHISNAIGTILPVKDMIKMAHDAGALTLIDGCQAVPHMKVDVQDLDADFYTFSAHKLYGPTGIGTLYGKADLLDAMPPWQGGGDMIEEVTFEKTTFNILPQKFEAGTPNIAGGIGYGAAIDYVNAIGYDAIHAHEQELLDYALSELRGINRLRLIGDAKDRASIISFVIDGAHPHDVGTILDQEGIAVRTGHHCTQPIMDRFNVPGTVRASFAIYNTKDDVDSLVAGVKKALSIFG